MSRHSIVFPQPETRYPRAPPPDRDSECTRLFETCEELGRHEAGHGSDKVLEEVAALKLERRRERLERIKEQETLRLLNEMSRQSIASQQADAPTTTPTDTITQLPLATKASESRDGGGGTEEANRRAWGIPQHQDICEPGEFACRWSPCDVAFESYGELIRHIGTHQLVFQCKWMGCNDVVPVTDALRHLTYNKHKAHKDKICRWKSCSQRIFDRRQLNDHLRICMNLQRSVFKCPWRDCHKYIKRYSDMKRHLVKSHWKLRKAE
jgi:hypothetical protein